MNLLPLLLLIFLLGGKNIKGFGEILQKIDFESFAPILTLLGIDPKITDALKSEDLQKALSGNLTDIKSLLPLVSSFLAKSGMNIFGNKKDGGEKSTPSESPAPENNYLKPIKNIAPEDIEEGLSGFFA